MHPMRILRTARAIRERAPGETLRIGCILACLIALQAVLHATGTLSAPGLVDQTNDVRLRSGVGTLTVHPLLAQVAQAKAEDMAKRGYFSHNTPDGDTFYDLITNAGYQFQAVAENLAVGLAADEALIAAWMSSPGHRHNLLNEQHTDIGIGIARGRYKGHDTAFVVQLFARPKRPAAVRASR